MADVPLHPDQAIFAVESLQEFALEPLEAQWSPLARSAVDEIEHARPRLADLVGLLAFDGEPAALIDEHHVDFDANHKSAGNREQQLPPVRWRDKKRDEPLDQSPLLTSQPLTAFA